MKDCDESLTATYKKVPEVTKAKTAAQHEEGTQVANGNKRLATHMACWLTYDSRVEQDSVQYFRNNRFCSNRRRQCALTKRIGCKEIPFGTGL